MALYTISKSMFGDWLATIELRLNGQLFWNLYITVSHPQWKSQLTMPPILNDVQRSANVQAAWSSVAWPHVAWQWSDRGRRRVLTEAVTLQWIFVARDGVSQAMAIRRFVHSSIAWHSFFCQCMVIARSIRDRCIQLWWICRMNPVHGNSRGSDVQVCAWLRRFVSFSFTNSNKLVSVFAWSWQLWS